MKGVRVTFAPDELRGLYPLIGAEIGRLQAWAAIEDRKLSEISMKVAGLRMLQDRIEESLKKSENEEKPTPATSTQPLVPTEGQQS